MTQCNFTYSFCITLMAFLPVVVGLANAASAETLLVHYKFDGNGNDSSMNGLTSTLQGTAVFGPGKFGEALILDGEGWAQTPDNPLLDLGSDDFTVALWASFSEHGGEQTLIEKGSSTFCCTGWTVSTFDAGGDERKLYANGIFYPQMSSPQPFGLNEFHHVAWVRKGSNAKFYFDGNLALMANGEGNVTEAGDLWIGRRNEIDGRDFNLTGALDDVRIYLGALSQAEIQMLIPEPSGSVLLLLGAAGVLVRRRMPRYEKTRTVSPKNLGGIDLRHEPDLGACPVRCASIQRPRAEIACGG